MKLFYPGFSLKKLLRNHNLSFLRQMSSFEKRRVFVITDFWLKATISSSLKKRLKDSKGKGEMRGHDILWLVL